MNYIKKLCLLWLLSISVWNPILSAQIPGTPARVVVDVTINISEYDVVFLTELFDIRSQRLAATAPSLSVELRAYSSGEKEAIQLPDRLPVRIHMSVEVRLRGENRFKQLVDGISREFTIDNGYKLLTARDFASKGIASADLEAGKYTQDVDLKKKISDYAQTNTTVPPGVYVINIEVKSSDQIVIGKGSKTIVIPYGSVDEVFVEINEPRDGGYFDNLAPTFTWVSSQKDVRLLVYEVGTNHRSPQDALTGGEPCLIWTSYKQEITTTASDVSVTSFSKEIKPIRSPENNGITSLTYPSNAQRQLQQNKAYVVLVEAKVETNRGSVMRPSKPVVFRISDDKIGKILDNFMSTQSEDISNKYFSLRTEPSNWIYWPSYGDITIDGIKLNESDLGAILQDISSHKDLKIEFDIENQ